MERFRRNKQTITSAEQEIISNKRVLVIGCGGLGSFVIEGLARIGFGHIGICDYDVIEESNLNRQILTTEKNIGKSKVEEANIRIKKINNNISIRVFKEKYPNKELDKEMLEYDIVVDCLDNIATRKILEQKCIEVEKPLVYGSIAGNYGYCGVSSKDNQIISFQNSEDNSLDSKLGNPFYIVGIVSSFQLYLAIRVVLKKEYLKRGFYSIDLNDMSLDKIELD